MVSSEMLWTSFLSSWRSFSSALISGYQKGLSLHGSSFRATLATPDASQWPPQKYLLALNHTRASQSDYKSLDDGTIQASVSASWHPDCATNISKQRGQGFTVLPICTMHTLPVQIHITFNK